MVIGRSLTSLKSIQMYTKCPECQAIFRVTEEQLSIAEGLVRCGICDAIFNGREHIEDNHDHDPATEVEHEHLKDGQSDSDTDENNDKEKWQATEEDLKDEDELIKADVVPTAIRDDFGWQYIN